MHILMVEDQPLVRQRLRRLLADSDLDAVVHEARDGVEALQKAGSAPWDVVLLDIALPGLSGIQVLKTLRTKRPATPVLMLSLRATPQHVSSSLKAGAAGYIRKESAADELVNAIQTVIRGGRYVSPGLTTAC